ncbi:hypothetical protein NSU_3369 [Novosphingobium pentaromativorans US6-1]|uniref:FAD-binding domain-containing protein n=1 Tax=Novosphingobium pentaromativorans US6-1 TaxID=1088721 RepID=G6EG98_9SPHN|nr:hypothetical protein NSU_3369 [Novosphingobium pentaromativorans US6-1]
MSLGMADIPVLVLEAEQQLTHDLRAGAFHPPTIEMLDRLGAAERMFAAGGLPHAHWQLRDRVEGLVADFDLNLLADETRFPYRLHLEQHRLTPILLDLIRTTTPSVEVQFGQRVTAVNPDSDGVTVETASDTFRGRYAIGCEGVRSVVREAMGVNYEGFTWEDRYLATSTSYQLHDLGFAGAGYISDPEAWAAVFHVPDTGPPGIWRIVYPIGPEVDEKQELQPENLQKKLFHILGSANPEPPGGVFPLHYNSIYRVHQRVATCFARDRLIVAGDAAHANNPLGGLGLNSGIHDAVNISAKLIEIWHNGADSVELFDRYDRQRRPIHHKHIQAMSIRNKRMLEERDPVVRRQNLDEQRAIAEDPVRARAYLMETSMINSVREAAEIE